MGVAIALTFMFALSGFSMEREGSIDMVTFARLHNGNEMQAAQLLEKFANPPSIVHFPVSNFVWDNYKNRKEDSKLAGAVAALNGKYFLNGLAFKDPTFFEDCVNAFGFRPNFKSPEDQYKMYLLSHASLFKFSGYGSCSFRTSYAALYLAEVFPKEIEIYLESFLPNKDHFVVKLGNDVIGWFIYDPLTNPEKIFRQEFYLTNILCTFVDGKPQARKFYFKVEKQLASEFRKQWPQICDLLAKIANANKPNGNALLRDINYVNVLLDNQIHKTDFNIYVEKALEKFDIQFDRELFKICAMCSKLCHHNRCSTCKEVYYCNRDCQKKHWSTHKNQCSKK